MEEHSGYYRHGGWAGGHSGCGGHHTGEFPFYSQDYGWVRGCAEATERQEAESKACLQEVTAEAQDLWEFLEGLEQEPEGDTVDIFSNLDKNTFQSWSYDVPLALRIRVNKTHLWYHPLST
jgi:hypothetical protein